MIKLHIIKSIDGETAARIQNKIVQDVTEFCILSLAGKHRSWQGSTEKEYFSVVFINGVLSVSISEREMRLLEEARIYALSTEMIKAANEVDEIRRTEMVYNYLNTTFISDIKEITFEDVMKVLNWKPKNNLKIGFDDLLLSNLSLSKY